jgi:hypothetical protein
VTAALASPLATGETMRGLLASLRRPPSRGFRQRPSAFLNDDYDVQPRPGSPSSGVIVDGLGEDRALNVDHDHRPRRRR